MLKLFQGIFNPLRTSEFSIKLESFDSFLNTIQNDNEKKMIILIDFETEFDKLRELKNLNSEILFYTKLKKTDDSSQFEKLLNNLNSELDLSENFKRKFIFKNYSRINQQRIYL